MSPSRSTSHASSISSRSPSREGRPPTPRHPPEFSPTLPATGEDLVDDPSNLLDIKGLRQKRQPRALDEGPLLRIEDIPRQEHHSLTQRGKSALDFTIETDAVDARHLGVAEDQVIGSLREELQRPIAAQCNLDVMSHPLQGFGEHPGDLWFIVNDEDRRSEEHTSELQSPCNLVCRLLLEKKKRKYTRTSDPTKMCCAT